MYRLLIVDDEPKVRWRVQHMVGGFDLAWDSIAVADGAQALEALDEVDADLVLTDIRMPIMDGLAFLGELRARSNDAPVVMLSAHADFALARQAMRLGALDYLAKPLDPAELRGVLLRVGQLKDLATCAGRKAARDADGDAARVRLMTELLEGCLSSGDWQARARVLGMATLSAQALTISYPPTAHEAVAHWIEETLRATVEGMLLTVPWDRERLSVVICRRRAAGGATPTRTEKDAVATGEQAVQSLRQCPLPGIRVGLGGLYPVEEARASYLESVRRLQERESGPDNDGRGGNDNDHRCHLAHAQSGAVSIAAQHAVEQARAWIAAHYAQPLTLAGVAREVYLHPKYLCTVFPLVTGSSFGDYVANARIERAKTLLAETHSPCHLIAEQVGYHNERSFAQAFRRQVGLTPTEYRHAHMDVGHEP